MRLTVYLVAVRLFHAAVELQTTWGEYSFEPSDFEDVTLPTGARRVRSQSKPIEIDTPPLCRLGDVELPKNLERPPVVPPARRRLILTWDKWGWDASNVYHAAVRGLRGFRLACAGEAEKQASPAPAMVRWGIAFASRQLPHHRSFLVWSSRTSTGTLASTLDLRQAARWDSQAEADAWLRGAGLDPDRPLDGLGWNWLYPTVAELPFSDPPPVGAIAFEFPRLPSAPPPWEPAGEFRGEPAAEALPEPKFKRRSRVAAEQPSLFDLD